MSALALISVVVSDDWRTKCKNIPEILAEARKRDKFIDVQFLVGRTPLARYFSAHKLVLACRSPVFEAMFFGQLAEKREVITLSNDDPDAFEIMIKHLYGEGFVFTSIVLALKSYSIADKYFISALETKSANFIRASTITEKDFWDIIAENLYINKCIEEKFLSFIELNADKLIKSDKFLHVPEYIMKTFLQIESINVSEYELLVSATKWCLKNSSGDEKSKTQNHLQYVRFSVLTPKQFVTFNKKFPGIFDSSTSLSILAHLCDPASCELPAWCCTVKVARAQVHHRNVPANGKNDRVRPPLSRYYSD